jgi:hypothetical protein
VILAGPEPGRIALRPLSPPLDRCEEVPVSGVQVGLRLLQYHGGHVFQPRPLRGGLGGGQPGRQFAVGDIWLPRQVCLLPDAQPVVEHHPRAAERPGQRLPLAWCRVETVVVPKPHTESIFDFMSEYSDIRPGWHRVLSCIPGFLTKYLHSRWHRGPPRPHVRDHLGRICGPRCRTPQVQRRGRTQSPVGARRSTRCPVPVDSGCC